MQRFESGVYLTFELGKNIEQYFAHHAELVSVFPVKVEDLIMYLSIVYSIVTNSV